MEGRFFARVRDHSINSFDSVAFIQRLQARWPESKLLVTWDGLPIHRFKAVRAFQQTPAAENFVFERLPGYAPDLNPLDCGAAYPQATSTDTSFDPSSRLSMTVAKTMRRPMSASPSKWRVAWDRYPNGTRPTRQLIRTPQRFRKLMTISQGQRHPRGLSTSK